MDESILETIGSPLVRVESPEGVHIAAKIESFNPGGSAKDRPALYMIRRAEKSGDLSPGGEVIEATSGNTGIGLAMVCAVRGYDLTIVMPKSKSKERRQIMKAYGATIELIEGDMQTANQHAKNIAEKRDAVLISQFENPANPQSHYETTAEEILEQIGEREIDAFVAGVGTGGTLTGVASRLLEEFPDLDIYAVEPEQNAVLSEGNVGDDAYQGMGPGFVSPNLDTDLIDEVETVPIDKAETECRRLAKEEGILVGQSSGASSIAAKRVGERIAEPERECPPAPATIQPDGGQSTDCPLVVTVFWDSGERYLSTGVFGSN